MANFSLPQSPQCFVILHCDISLWPTLCTLCHFATRKIDCKVISPFFGHSFLFTQSGIIFRDKDRETSEDPKLPFNQAKSTPVVLFEGSFEAFHEVLSGPFTLLIHFKLRSMSAQLTRLPQGFSFDRTRCAFGNLWLFLATHRKSELAKHSISFFSLSVYLYARRNTYV